MTLTSEDYDYFRQVILQVSGIHLKAKKKDFAEARLRPQILELGLKGFSEYRDFLSKLPPSDSHWEAFINLFTTNKTDFFREPNHFEFMKSVAIPKWQAENTAPVRVWSAACSSGEEPYTISMVLNQEGVEDYKILATDIDTNIINAGKNAVYRSDRLREIPEPYKSECVDKGVGEIAEWIRIKLEIKNKVVFKRHNLLEETAPIDTPFDMVFLRNVMIYFQAETCEFILHKIYEVTKPGGFLMIGHSESLHNLKTPWSLVRASTYIKK